ncbi:hypothetical protein Acr_02g0011980 [Actinidia rufa]|uniref:UDP-Glycosyltransferase superfamily protein n=1 Tax=Actinidia rufa TaxID=165716 RepID=A0A7J0E919_9ERIC|nr:hypothetical protein Acr_02g0011980 [Actinidia rufa]
MEAETPHVVFFPSPSMGHLKPFLRLAAMLESRNCSVTLISTQPTVCAEESASFSSFFSSHPNIKRLEFQILTEKGPDSKSENAFITQFKAINRSVHLLPPLLASLPQPVSVIFSDFVVAASLAQITASHGIPNFIVSTTCARCYSMVAYLPVLLSDTPAKFKNGFDEIQIPGLAPLPKSIIPPSWLDDYDSPSNHLVTDYLIPNAQSLPKVGGVLLNSFNWFEPETIPALLDRRVLSNLPPLYPIGPLEPHELEQNHGLPWLDDQTAESVLYVNFGTRTAMSEDQTRELAKGLESSGFPFLWVLGPNSVDEDEKETILAHRSIGGFFNQADWDSVTEAAREGVPMLVRGEEAERRVRELMGDENLRVKAKKVREKAKEAFRVGGSSENALIRSHENVETERLYLGERNLMGCV